MAHTVQTRVGPPAPVSGDGGGAFPSEALPDIVGQAFDFASGFIQSSAILQGGTAEAFALRARADQAEFNSSIVLEQGIENTRRFRLNSLRFQGTQRAAAAATGFDITRGSAKEILEESVRQTSVEAQSILHQSDLQSSGFLLQAAALDEQATQVESAARRRAAETKRRAAGGLIGTILGAAIGTFTPIGPVGGAAVGGAAGRFLGGT